jgi:hypothetical protein
MGGNSRIPQICVQKIMENPLQLAQTQAVVPKISLGSWMDCAPKEPHRLGLHIHIVPVVQSPLRLWHAIRVAGMMVVATAKGWMHIMDLLIEAVAARRMEATGSCIPARSPLLMSAMESTNGI